MPNKRLPGSIELPSENPDPAKQFAVVSADVPAYQIVAGAPARSLKPRFPSEIAARIEALGWWDWPRERLFEAIPDMQTLSIEAFLDRWEGGHDNSRGS